jgi:glycosyltransferase involved in cell wall biosynthesis
VKGCLFNTDAEARLAERLYGVRDGTVVGMGFEAPDSPPTAEFAASQGLDSFLLYTGRLEEGKRVDVAVEYAVRYAAEREDPPRLVLAGRGSYSPPPWAADVVVEAGSLDGEKRRAAKAEALAVVIPSVLESLSIVLLEAWLEETPALVAGGSDVLREHCKRSGGGFPFNSYEEFRDALDRLRDDEDVRIRMGAAGRAYVLEEYSWPAVRGRFESAVAKFVR